MAQISFRPLWTIEVSHAFFGGVGDALSFVIPPSTAQALAGAHAMAREKDGRLHVLFETNEQGQPLVTLAERRFLFGLRPRDASFSLISAALGMARGATAVWDNAANANALSGPRPVYIAGEHPRLVPHSGERPLTLRLFDGGNTLVDQAPLHQGDESWTPNGLLSRGAWRVEEQGARAPASWTLQIEPDLVGAWGMLALDVSLAHLAAGQTFTLSFAARNETLCYYVVAQRFTEADFNQIDVVDTGYGNQARSQIQFDRLLPSDFSAQHLSPALLDPSGQARIALFQARAAVARQARGPAGLTLQRNGDVLIGNLPQPGAERSDAQFVIHLSQT